MGSAPTSHLSPDDAAVAVRSFPRRFRALLAQPADDERVDPDELARRPGPDGRSAVDHLLAADAVLSLLGGVLEQVRRTDDPAVDAAVGDLGGVRGQDPHAPLGALLDRLAATAPPVADAIDAVPTEGWGGEVRVGDARRQLLDVVRDTVDVVAGHLRSAERTIQAVR